MNELSLTFELEMFFFSSTLWKVRQFVPERGKHRRAIPSRRSVRVPFLGLMLDFQLILAFKFGLSLVHLWQSFFRSIHQNRSIFKKIGSIVVWINNHRFEKLPNKAQ